MIRKIVRIHLNPLSVNLMSFLFLELPPFSIQPSVSLVSPETSMQILTKKLGNWHVTEDEPNGNYRSTIVCARIRV